VKNVSHPIVELKGFRDSLRLIIAPDASIEQVELAIKKRMANLGYSLAGTTMNIDIRNETLSDDELNRVKMLLHETYGLEVERILDGLDRETEPAGNETHEPVVDWANGSSANRKIRGAPALHREENVVKNYFTPKIEEVRFIRHTLRCGQVERFLEGNMIVLGDVNPGAEVIATGDIIVLGVLRGVAHAGALGDASSVIIALNLVPTQLRIGHFITRPPSGRQHARQKAEIARVSEEAIIVEEYSGL
jgi:septum site-determining protein MinC